MSKSLIAAILFICFILAIILFVRSRPPLKIEAPNLETKNEEKIPTQVGKYELPPAQENVEPAVSQKATSVETTEALPEKTQKDAEDLTVITENDNGESYDSVDPSLPNPEPKLPPENELRQMREKGIVIF